MDVLTSHWIWILGLGVYLVARLSRIGSGRGDGGGTVWGDCDGGDGGD